MRGFYVGYLNVTGMLYMALMTNLLLLVANLPLVFLVVFTDLTGTWLLALVSLPFLAPALKATFAVFREHASDGRTTVVRTFARSWADGYARTLGVGALATAGLGVLAVDVAVVWGRSVGALMIPVFGMFAALLVATTLAVLVAIDLDADLRGLDLWKACLVLVVRRWYLSAFTLFALGVFSTFLVTMPVWAVGLAASPMLYLAWANGTYTLQPRLVERPEAVAA